MTPEQLKASYGRQLALLVRMLPIVARESCFAIKGGTAINLFHRELPRLSVDIDLTYLPIANRRESLDGIADALGRIGERIESEHPYVRVKPEALKGERRLYKLNLEQRTTKIKVEASTDLRGCVYPHERRAMSCCGRCTTSPRWAVKSGTDWLASLRRHFRCAIPVSAGRAGAKWRTTPPRLDRTLTSDVGLTAAYRRGTLRSRKTLG